MRKLLKESKVCLNLDCNNTFEVIINSKKKFCCKKCYWKHLRGKSYEEIYGEEKAKELKGRRGKEIKGKTYEEYYGEEKAKEIKQNLRNKHMGRTKETHLYVVIRAEKLRGRTKENHPGVARAAEKKSGEKCYNWRGGISKLPYSFNFNEELKELIRKRDNYQCQLCGKTQEESLSQWGEKLSIHHIDYLKENSNPINLISLCRGCNTRVNFGRKHWIKFFQQKLKIRVG